LAKLFKEFDNALGWVGSIVNKDNFGLLQQIQTPKRLLNAGQAMQREIAGVSEWDDDR
jgi:hypothetical protein